MGAALPFVAAASIGASALGSISQGYATSAADKVNATIAAQNAAIAKQNASYAGAEGKQRAGIEEQKTRQQVGAIKANQGASGIDVNSGSAAAVQASQATIGQLDAMTIRSNAARQAYGYQTQAAGDLNQAAIDRSSAHNAVTQGYIGAVSGAAKQAAWAYESGLFSSTPSDPWSGYLSDTGMGSVTTGSGAVNSGTGGLY